MAVELLVGDVDEKSSAIATVAFTDENGDPFTPDAVFARIDCASTSTSIRSETQITPVAQSMNIAIAHTENAIHDATKAFELHEITIRATYDGTSQVTASGKYKVRNLAFLT